MNEIVLSTPPARRVLPSGENATVIGSSRVPCEVLCKAPELASYTRTTVSPSPVPIRVPSGEKATETEPPNGGEISAPSLQPIARWQYAKLRRFDVLLRFHPNRGAEKVPPENV